MNCVPPSESTVRRRLPKISKEIIRKIKTRVEEAVSGIFVIFDETNMDNTSYASTLVGTLENPSEIFLLGVKELDAPLNARTTCRLIDDQIRKFEITREKVMLHQRCGVVHG